MTQANLVFTNAAAHKVKQLMDELQDYDLRLRVYISGGGCSGFQYNFTFEKEQKADDLCVTTVINTQDPTTAEIAGTATTCGFPVHLIIDPLSFQYLTGAEIDYRKDIQGEQFVIRNPNAKTTCGCGSSFAVD